MQWELVKNTSKYSLQELSLFCALLSWKQIMVCKAALSVRHSRTWHQWSHFCCTLSWWHRFCLLKSKVACYAYTWGMTLTSGSSLSASMHYLYLFFSLHREAGANPSWFQVRGGYTMGRSPIHHMAECRNTTQEGWSRFKPRNVLHWGDSANHCNTMNGHRGAILIRAVIPL